ncbi:MAG: hypothetical protein E7419_07625 [Ruminococcaceae bacterium]|nr:hypothetical protein [Oscillospiraceae bacterium]
MNENKNKLSREEYLYHNTEILLKKNREVVWSIETSAIQARTSLELEMDCNLEEFLEMSSAVGIDLEGTQIREQIRTVERNKKMLKIIEVAVNLLKENPQLGEEYYWVLFYTYLSKKKPRSVDYVIDNMYEQTGIYISQKTYYKYRKAAINKLSTILWGFTSKDTLDIINRFV